MIALILFLCALIPGSTAHAGFRCSKMLSHTGYRFVTLSIALPLLAVATEIPLNSIAAKSAKRTEPLDAPEKIFIGFKSLFKAKNWTRTLRQGKEIVNPSGAKAHKSFTGRTKRFVRQHRMVTTALMIAAANAFYSAPTAKRKLFNFLNNQSTKHHKTPPKSCYSAVAAVRVIRTKESATPNWGHDEDGNPESPPKNLNVQTQPATVVLTVAPADTQMPTAAATPPQRAIFQPFNYLDENETTQTGTTTTQGHAALIRGWSSATIERFKKQEKPIPPCYIIMNEKHEPIAELLLKGNSWKIKRLMFNSKKLMYQVCPRPIDLPKGLEY